MNEQWQNPLVYCAGGCGSAIKLDEELDEHARLETVTVEGVPVLLVYCPSCATLHDMEAK